MTTTAGLCHAGSFAHRRLVYHRGMGELTGFVLAGGQSTRMGTDKAFIEWEGRTLLTRAMQSLSTVTSDIRILGSAQKFAKYGPVIEDEFLQHGPLAGIHAALRAGRELNLILAVDMAFVEVQFLEYLVQEAGKCRATVTLPRTGGGWQPLCAVYRQPFLELAERALRQNQNRIDALFRATEVRVLEEKEFVKQGFSPGIFRNLNTPEELRESRLKMDEPRPLTEI
jgi:molybdenum cofactor guanylyltransferase